MNVRSPELSGPEANLASAAAQICKSGLGPNLIGQPAIHYPIAGPPSSPGQLSVQRTSTNGSIRTKHDTPDLPVLFTSSRPLRTARSRDEPSTRAAPYYPPVSFLIITRFRPFLHVSFSSSLPHLSLKIIFALLPSEFNRCVPILQSTSSLHVQVLTDVASAPASSPEYDGSCTRLIPTLPDRSGPAPPGQSKGSLYRQKAKQPHISKTVSCSPS